MAHAVEKDQISHVEHTDLRREPTIVSTHDYVGSYPIPAHQAQYRNAPMVKMGNPSPIGLFAFSLTTFVLSFMNAGIGKVAVPNIVIGLTLFYGGLAQFIAGILELFAGNTFAAQAFISYAAFWLSYSAIYVPFFGITAAFEATEAGKATFGTAVGIYLSAWAIYTLIVFLACMRTSIAFVVLIGVLEVTFWLLAAGAFTGHDIYNKVGGYFGLIVGILGWYNAASSIITVESSGWSIPVGTLGQTYTQQARRPSLISFPREIV